MTEEPLVAICAHCHPNFRPVGIRVTHTICIRHFNLEMAELERRTGKPQEQISEP